MLLADDEHLIRGALAALLALEDDLRGGRGGGDRPGGAGDGAGARPDVAVLDLQMPGADGVRVATSLRAELPGCRVLIVTSHGRPGHLKRALAAGVRGFVPKTVSAQRLAEIIRTVHAGNRYVDPELAADAISAGDSPLTAREAEVLELAADGAPVAEIAERAVAVAGDRTELSVVGRLEARCGEPARGGASRARARLGIVALALRRSADVAQLVERNLAKVEVASSNLVVRSGRRRPRSIGPGASSLCRTRAYDQLEPVRRSYASMYLARVASTTSCGQRRRGLLALAVPAGGRRGQPVADELLVVGRLGAARLPLVGGPEAGGVRGQHLVGEDQASSPVEAELELGVGQDDARARGRCRGPGRRRRGSSGAAGRRSRRRPGGRPPRSETFSSCSPTAALVAGVKIGRGQLGAVDQALGEGEAADRAGLVVLGEARSR